MNMTPHHKHRRVWAPALLALVCALPMPLLAATPDPATTASMTPGTTRFATDAAVREGMLAIRSAMAEKEAAIAANQLDATAYAALAQRMDAALQGPLAQRSLPKTAAVAFRGSIWQDLEYCIGLMRTGRSVSMQRTGAFGVQQVLRNYALYFDHPGW